MTDYAVLSPVAVRASYVTLTDKLIHGIEQHPELDHLHLLFLDKSARPVAWLVRAFWRLFARRPGTRYAEGVVPPMPSMSFANIDREQWWALTGASENATIDVSLVPERDVASLRAAYLRRRPVPGSSPWAQPAILDHRRIVVIDEVRATGDTLVIATGLVARAFPTATVTAMHWMVPGVVRDPVSGQNRIQANPVWYRHDTPRGRLIGDRLAPDHKGTHWRGVVGALFLSTVPSTPDAMGIQLKREIRALSADVAAGTLLALPDPEREDFDERVRLIYGYRDVRAFTRARVAQVGA